MKKGCLRKILIGFLALLILCALLLAGVFFAFGFFGAKIVARQIESRTGYPAKMDFLSINPFAGKLAVRGLRIKNPAQFPDESFVNLRRLEVQLKLLSLFQKRLVFKEVFVDFEQFGYVVNKQKEKNASVFLDKLQPPEESKAAANKKPEEKAAAENKPFQFLIQHLLIQLDSIKMVDQSKWKRTDRVYPVALKVEKENVTGVNEVTAAVTAALAIKGAPILVDAFQDLLPADLLKEKKAGGFLKNIFDKITNH